MAHYFPWAARMNPASRNLFCASRPTFRLDGTPENIGEYNIPTSCYSKPGISHTAFGLGDPMLTHKPRLDPFNIGDAKILAEIELDKNFPKKIALDDMLEMFVPTNESRQDQEKVEILGVDIKSLLENNESEASSAKTDSLSSHGANSPKNSSVAFEHLSPIVKSTSVSTLAGSPSAHTTPTQVMDNVPSAIIINEGATPSGNDPTSTTPHSTKFIQEHGNIESDFHINKQIDEYGSVSRGGKLPKLTQRYQEMEWHTVHGRGNRGRKGRVS
ncbi:hypothetical protein F2Q69_00009012 [Brassica cretica]|uniref:Uncharacterized protein n=1 Tax=Brassica cretica TaxID=69181 RepID=A0A8S9PAB4_BRACR|nr:hypothetical protein F2Q69_00009012 [Brassica cretica]